LECHCRSQSGEIYTYRSLQKINMAAFSVNILQSGLHGELQLEANSYADLFDAEVKRVLDIHAPLRTGSRHCGQHDSRHLSDEVHQAKQQHEQLKCRYCQTGLQSDKEAYLMACSTACKGILKSQADIIKSSDVHATWRMAQRLLHSRHKFVYDDAQCVQLVLAFSQFFVDKVRCTRDNISVALQSSVHRTFAIR